MKEMYEKLFATTTHDVIRSCMRAYLDFIDGGDEQQLSRALEPLVAPDFVFVSPYGDLHGLKKYIETFAKWAPVVDKSESVFWVDADSNMFGGLAHLTLKGKDTALTTCDFYTLDQESKIVRIEMVTGIGNFAESEHEIRSIFA